ncbi:MAG: hypothetical protein KC423_17435 [Anaerolineales bacterium]|nr:hypothetical protein [Anaerolineales bacterium]MCA9966041.1 hypothetical protein [Anaerolineales bacterium]
MSRNYTIRMLFFGTLFLASLFSLLIFVLPKGLNQATEPGDGSNINGEGGAVIEEEPGVDLGTVLSVITAVISGLGFVFTTFFAYREDRRAAALHQIQLVNAQKEVARKDLEIEELRRKLQNRP